jgi:hypothetical protein
VDARATLVHAAVVLFMALSLGLRRRLGWSILAQAAVVSCHAGAACWLRRRPALYQRLRDGLTAACRLAMHLVPAMYLSVWFTTRLLYDQQQQQRPRRLAAPLAQEGWAELWYRLLLGSGIPSLNFSAAAAPLAFKHALLVHTAAWALHAFVGPGARRLQAAACWLLVAAGGCWWQLCQCPPADGLAS